MDKELAASGRQNDDKGARAVTPPAIIAEHGGGEDAGGTCMKNPPYEWLAAAINNHTWTVAGVAAAIFVLALFGLSMVTMQTGDDTYIDKNTPPGGALLDHYAETYGSDAIMLIYETDSVRSPRCPQVYRPYPGRPQERALRRRGGLRRRRSPETGERRHPAVVQSGDRRDHRAGPAGDG